MSDHHHPEPSEETEEGKPWGVVCTVCIVLAVLALIFTRGCSCSSSKDKKPMVVYVNTNSPTLVPTQEVWTHKTIPIPKGGRSFYLHNGWKIWALRGPIQIITPNEEVLYERHGVKHRVGNQPDGIYLVTSYPVGEETEVQIYNNWEKDQKLK